MWRPSFPISSKPLYLALADAIDEAVRNGELRPDDRLPTQRELAQSLGVTVGTAHQAYQEARRRGTLRTLVGSGSYVRSLPASGGVYIGGPEMDLALSDVLGVLSRTPRLTAKLVDDRVQSYPELREAGVAWIARCGLFVSASRVVPCAGAHHALSAMFAALAHPGDTVLCEEMTYPGVPALAAMHGLRVVGLAMDEEGLVPEAVDEYCATSKATILYLVPTLQVPRVTVMSATRRAAIAEVARKHDLIIVEDDDSTPLLEDAPPLLAAFAPERTVYVADPTRALCPALRHTYVGVPEDLAVDLARGARATLIAVPPLDGCVIAHWIWEGVVDRLIAERRAALAARHQAAVAALADTAANLHPASEAVWFPLPSGWDSRRVLERAEGLGLKGNPPQLFRLPPTQGPDAVRLSLLRPAAVDGLGASLSALADLIRRPPPLEVPQF
jgi:DNA-binding transcriptional MocR family regulator